MNYLIIPLGNISVAVVLWVMPNATTDKNVAETYIVFYFGNCVSRIVEYFTMIQRTVILDANIYIKVRAEI